MAFRLNKKLKYRIWAIAILAGILIMLMTLAGYPQLVEQYYSRGLYRGISIILHPVLNLFPFSVGDVLYVAVSLVLVVTLVTMIVRLFNKQFQHALCILLNLIMGILAGVVAFHILWGMNYYRQPAAVRLNLQNSTYTLDELKKVTLLLIDSANAARSRLTADDMQTSNDSIYHYAVKTVKKLSASSDEYRAYSPGIKPSLLTPLINYLSTSGYYNPFTSEAQINYQMPVQLRPFVACHELSHQMGFGPEDEASFAGFVAGVNAEDRLLRYSVYYEGMTEFMFTLRGADSLTFKQFKKRISPRVRADLKAEQKYWQYYEGRLEVISGFFYDKYLKANNQPQGLATYNQMITLVMAWYNRGQPAIKPVMQH